MKKSSRKLPLHLFPAVAEIEGALALEDGAVKRSPFNWRTRPISAMRQIDGIKRHIAAYVDGEDDAADSKRPHLAHALGRLAIMLDAEACGTLIDDRPARGTASLLIAETTARRRRK